MKVLYFVDDFKGGAGNVIQLLSIEFVKRNHDVAICCLGGNTQGRHPIDGITVYRVASNKNLAVRYIEFIRQARRIIKNFKPDCVVSFLFGVSSWVNIAMVGMNIPHIVSERSDPNYLKPRGLMALLTEIAYLRAKKIVVLFDEFHNISGSKYRDKVVTIPNPVPIMPIIQTSTHLYEDEIRFITIANDTPPKGLDLLVQAFARLARDNENCVLRIYGKESDQLMEQIQNEGMQDRINLKGYTLDVSKALSWADVYVMPSRHEGFPNSLCEAMSAGKCCIATLCHNGIKEIIEDGENGLIAKQVSADALYEEMFRIMKDPDLIQELGSRATALTNKYDLDNVVSLWEALIYNTILR